MHNTYVLGRRRCARAEPHAAQVTSYVPMQAIDAPPRGATHRFANVGNVGSPMHHGELIPRPVVRAEENL